MADDRNDTTHLNDTDVDAPPANPTSEVGSEGGTFGDVEVGADSGAGTGSEAGETWRPSDGKTERVVRDETGEGRRNP